MKITQIKIGQKGKTYSAIDIEALVDDILKGVYQQAVKEYQELMLMQNAKSYDGASTTVVHNSLMPSKRQNTTFAS